MTRLAAPARLDAVRASGLWELGDEERHPFDRLVRLACDQLGVPVAALSLVGERRQRLVATRGVDRLEFDVDDGVCRRVVESAASLVVPDTRYDERYGLDSFPARQGVISYAGVPLRDAAGEVLGTLCAVQGRAKVWTAAEVRLLEELSEIGTAEILLRTTAAGRARAERALVDAEARLALTVESAPIALFGLDAEARITVLEGSVLELLGVEPGRLVGRSARTLFGTRLDLLADLERSLAGESLAVVHRFGDRIFELRVRPLLDEGTVAGVAGVFVDVSERLRDQARIAELAYVDRLTQLPNRTWLEETVDRALGAGAEAAGRTAALLFVDLDEFQAVNDSLGHAAGDNVLQEAALRLRAVTPERGRLARQGADEFMLFLDDLGPDPQGTAERVAGEAIAALEAPFVAGGLEFHVESSVGISLFPRDGGGYAELLRGAESALHRAKRTAGTRVAVHHRDDGHARGRLTMSARLRRALSEEQFVLHYQPIFALADGRPSGVEALLRWEDPDRGRIPPLDFIGVAEATGLIVPIGEWVAETACRQAVAWRELGLDISVGFNVSPIQLQRGDFACRLGGIVERTGADPRSLVVEVTESVAMEGGAEAERVLERLAEVGFSIVIDDFGAGHSSLTRLRQLRVASLKVDRALLEDVPGDAGAAAVVFATLALADALEIPTVAEGVETEAQRVFLRDRGCRYAQGFGLGRPQDAAAVTELLLATCPPLAGAA